MALDLARRTRQGDLAAAVLGATATAASEVLDREAPGAGYLLGLIEILVVGEEAPEIVDPLLERARAVYADNAWHTVSTIEYQLQMAGSDEERARSSSVTSWTWVGLAHESAGAVRMANLEAAVTAARNFGFGDLVENITAEMQAIDVEDLGLVRGPTPSRSRRRPWKVPPQFTNAPTWQDALTICALTRRRVTSPVIAKPRRDRQDRSAPAAIPRVRIGGDGLPRFTVSTDAEKEEWQLTEQDMHRPNVQGSILAEALDRIWKKRVPIPQDDFTAFLQGTHVGPSLAAALARDTDRQESLTFRTDDVELMRSLARPDNFGSRGGDELLRVIGTALGRVADAAVSFYVQTIEWPLVEGGAGPLALAKGGAHAAEEALELGSGLSAIFRHHLQDAVRRQRLTQPGGAGPRGRPGSAWASSISSDLRPCPTEWEPGS